MCECKKENPQSLQGAFMRLLHRYTEVNFGRLKDMGVHPGQLPFLNIISHKEGISQRELAECLHVKPPTVAGDSEKVGEGRCDLPETGSE